MSRSNLTRRQVLVWTGGAIASTRFFPALAASGADIPPQPYFASVKRALEALEKLGAPLAPEDAQKLKALASQNDADAVGAAENILEHYTLAHVVTSADGYAHATAGKAPKTLIEQGWRVFLVRVSNPIGTTAKLEFTGN